MKERRMEYFFLNYIFFTLFSRRRQRQRDREAERKTKATKSSDLILQIENHDNRSDTVLLA